jgi:DNA-binding transcriptional regulator YiaG
MKFTDKDVNLDELNKIQQLRYRAGLSQRGFCDHFHISLATVRKWELGENIPPKHVLYMIERILDFEEGKVDK